MTSPRGLPGQITNVCTCMVHFNSFSDSQRVVIRSTVAFHFTLTLDLDFEANLSQLDIYFLPVTTSNHTSISSNRAFLKNSEFITC